MEKVPRGVGVSDAFGLGLGSGSRAGALDAQPLSSLGMTEDIEQSDSVSGFSP